MFRIFSSTTHPLVWRGAILKSSLPTAAITAFGWSTTGTGQSWKTCLLLVYCTVSVLLLYSSALSCHWNHTKYRLKWQVWDKELSSSKLQFLQSGRKGMAIWIFNHPWQSCFKTWHLKLRPWLFSVMPSKVRFKPCRFSYVKGAHI